MFACSPLHVVVACEGQNIVCYVQERIVPCFHFPFLSVFRWTLKRRKTTRDMEKQSRAPRVTSVGWSVSRLSSICLNNMNARSNVIRQRNALKGFV
ncbi:unnamed protein product [Victoria cruziana]